MQNVFIENWFYKELLILYWTDPKKVGAKIDLEGSVFYRKDLRIYI